MNVRNFIPLSDFDYLTTAVINIARQVFNSDERTIRVWEGPHHVLHFHDVNREDYKSFLKLVSESFTELSEKQKTWLDDLIIMFQINWGKAHTAA